MSLRETNAEYAAVMDNLTEQEEIERNDLIAHIGDALEFFESNPAALFAPLATGVAVISGVIEPKSLRVALLNQFIDQLADQLKVNRADVERRVAGVGVG